jgi:hypothetical protein
MEYIYLLRTREFIRFNENIYKIGKTTQEPNNRLRGYPKGSEILYIISVKNCHETELLCINKFKYEYVQKRDYGIEYFEGNVKDMIKTINYILNIKNDIKNTKIIKKKYLDQFLIKHLKQISLYFGIYIRYCKKNTIIKRLKHIEKNKIDDYINGIKTYKYICECVNLSGFGSNTFGHHILINNYEILDMIVKSKKNDTKWRDTEYIFSNYDCSVCKIKNVLLIKQNQFFIEI